VANILELVDKLLLQYLNTKGFMNLGILGAALYQNEYGALLADSRPLLASEFAKRRRKKTQNQDNIEYVLGKIEGSCLTKNSKKILKDKFDIYNKEYERLLTIVLQSMTHEEKKQSTINELYSNIRSTIGDYSIVRQKKLKLTSEIIHRIPKLLAQISALWTLLYTRCYNEALGTSEEQAELFRPHVAQILCILRILGIGYDRNSTIDNSYWLGGLVGRAQEFFHNLANYKPVVDQIESLRNNLVEVGTGEGKSLILGFTAAILALLGIDVNVSCYSDYLSCRDRADMKLLFEHLHITDYIHYGTFHQLCETFLDEKVPIRKTIEHMMSNNLDRPEIFPPVTTTTTTTTTGSINSSITSKTID
jgi:hypothetical protein